MNGELSRGQFLRRSAAAAGTVAGLALAEPLAAFGKPGSGIPNPIPGGFTIGDTVFHVMPPSLGSEVSTITDFNGVIGAAEIQGTASGNGTSFDFDTDMRFMQGVYVDTSGRVQQDSFGFI
jgi:hypothetical protein